MPAIEYIAYGPRAALQSEVGTPDFYEGKFLVQIIGDGQWDAEGFRNITEARAYAKDLAATYATRISHIR